ncbi:hypothetical protein PF001_g32634, partial [Phytophthora fragariae]
PSTSVNSKRVGAWQECNMEVNVAFYMTADMAKPYNSYVTDLQNDNLRVLIYACDADLMCNWNGNQAWTRALEFWHTRSCAQTRAAKRSPYLRRRYLYRSSAVASAASDWSCASARHCSTPHMGDYSMVSYHTIGM